MTNQRWTELDPQALAATRDALHAYAGILGGWISACRTPRRHWWHASLRPSLTGVTTGVIYADTVTFEMVLNFRESVLSVRTAAGEQMTEDLRGQAVAEPAVRIRDFLRAAGLSEELAEAAPQANPITTDAAFPGYSPEEANKIASALGAVTASLVSFRSEIREETGPIALWPHHFDLAMLWLPGEKVPGQNPDDEEAADAQMNFGFVFGDDGIPEPYFYVTAYPLPDAFPTHELPAGTHWHTDGFRGAVLLYRRLTQESDPHAYLARVWHGLLADGRRHLVSHSMEGS